MTLAFFNRLSIRQRLPLLITSLLLFIILVFGIISYLNVRKAALQVGGQRLQTSALQISNMLSNSTHNMVATAHAQANRPSVVIFLLSGQRDSAVEVRKWFSDLQNDTTYLDFALVNASHIAVFRTSTGAIKHELPFESFHHLEYSRKEVGEVGDMQLRNDSVYYPVTAVISKDNQILGYLVKWRRMQTTRGSVEQVNQLIGAGAKFYVGNADGSLWTDMVHPVRPRPYSKPDSNVLSHTIAGRSILASIRTVPSSQWLVAVENPLSSLLESAQNYLYWLLAAGSLLLIFGTTCGWIMSRNISKPLVQLTAATSTIAAGDYSSSSVPLNRPDELGKLARSFNAMAVQVQSSKLELEKEAGHYRLLFEKNPMPMWIVSSSTYNILDVNDAALHHYGYSREEFLQLNSRDMRPAEDVEKFLTAMHKDLHGGTHRGTWRHKKKDGSVILVDIIANDIIYEGQPARLTLANDITDKLKAEAELISNRIMQQQIITETTILVQEKEREEIGRELHDNINQILTSTKLYLELAKTGDKELLKNALSKSYDNINLVMGEIRRLSRQLVKPAFDTSLKDALRDMTEELQVIAGLEIDFCHAGFDENLLDENTKLIIYRVVQEQLNNILKHATANRVNIHLETDIQNVCLSIKDDGVGFDTNKKSKGIGLRNINNRVAFHKGRVRVNSKPGGGCILEISIPFKKEIGTL